MRLREAGTVSEDGRSVEDIGRDFVRAFYERKESTWGRTKWLGVGVAKLPLDLWILQEIVVETRPDLIVEAGVGEGGGTLFFATLMDLLGRGEVIGVDVDLSQVDDRVRSHPRVSLIEGSSVSEDVVARLREGSRDRRVMVDLDSDHGATHVLEELRRLSDLVSPGCYLVVEDSVVNGNPVEEEYGPGPREAIQRWMADAPPFDVDRSGERLLASFNPGGYLRRLGDDPGPPPGGDSGAGPDDLERERILRARAEHELAGLRAALERSVAEGEALRRTVAGSSRRFRLATERLREQDDLVDEWRERAEELEAKLDAVEREAAGQRQRLENQESELVQATVRLERIQASLPMRIATRLRGLPVIRRMFARRAQAYWSEVARRGSG